MIRTFVVALVALLAVGCATTTPRRPGTQSYVLPRSAKAEGNTRFIVFDLGQADGMLVIRNGRTLLVDAGVSRFGRPGDRGIARILREAVPSGHLDIVLITHYHADHVGAPLDEAGGGATGLFDVVNDGFTIGTIVDRGDTIYGKAGDTMLAYQNALSRWLADGRVGERRIAKAGDVLDLADGLRIEVVAANSNGVLEEKLRQDPKAFEKFEPSENDLSVALKFTQGDFELFAGGDLSGENLKTDYGGSYSDIESLVAARVGDVEVYKVNHHGSDHSTNACFARVLDPEVSIFTTGVNRYRHPAKRVFRTLSDRGDVRVTGGADDRALAEEPSIGNAVVRGDVEVVVAPTGAKYWVNGRYFRSKTTAQERDRDDFLAACTEEDRDQHDGE